MLTFLGSGLAFVTEEDKEAQPLSKRQQRIAALGGPVGADGTAKGSVRTRDGNLEYLQEKVCKGEAASWSTLRWSTSLPE